MKLVEVRRSPLLFGNTIPRAWAQVLMEKKKEKVSTGFVSPHLLPLRAMYQPTQATVAMTSLAMVVRP